MHGETEHPAAHVGDVPSGIDGSEVGQQLRSSLHRPMRWWRDEREVIGWCAPGGEFQCQPGEVDLVDLGRAMFRTGAVLDLAPEPVARAGFDATRSAGALVG